MEWDEGFEVVTEGGLARARMLPRPRCAFCGDTGRREVEVRGVVRAGRCRCQKLPDRIALFNAAGIPARHASCTLENFKTDVPGAEMGYRQTRKWLDGFRPGEERKGLVLTGEPGRGKTHLLVGTLRELLFRHGVEARFVEFTHLLSTIRDGIGRNDGEATTLTPMARVPVLAVDELGKGRGTDWELGVIDEIITRRYNGNGLLLATTNFPLKAPEKKRDTDKLTLAQPQLPTLEERLGERVFSRLRETVQFAGVIGEDYRRRTR